MKKILLCVILVSGCQLNSFAQTENAEAPAGKKEKNMEHTVGVQLNGLIRQVLNFSNSTSAIVNPYLVTYNLNLRKSGWGLRAGVGYDYVSNWNNDGISEVTSKINQARFRLGIEKAFRLSPRWSTGVGVDGLVSLNDDHTTSVVRSFDTVTTVTKTNITSYGGGVMSWLRYNITSRITIGTEASMYYTTGNQDNNIKVTRKTRSSGGISITTVTETKSKPTVSEARINLPIVFYLAVNF